MRERRSFELRHAGGGRLEGVVMRYGVPADIQLPDGRTIRERFDPGAFGDLGRLDVELNWRHQPRLRLARTSDGTLQLRDTDQALLMRAHLGREQRFLGPLAAYGGARLFDDLFGDDDDEDEDPDRIYFPDDDPDLEIEIGFRERVLDQVRRGRARGLSVEFDAERESFDGRERRIHAALLGGVAVTPNPAYFSSTVEARERLARLVDSGGYPSTTLPPRGPGRGHFERISPDERRRRLVIWL